MWYMRNNKDKSGQPLDISPKLSKNQKLHGKMIKINHQNQTMRYYFTSTTKMHISKTTDVCRALEKQAFIMCGIEYAVATLESICSVLKTHDTLRTTSTQKVRGCVELFQTAQKTKQYNCTSIKRNESCVGRVGQWQNSHLACVRSISE